MNDFSRQNGFPDFDFHTVDLHIDPPVEWNEIYQEVRPSGKVGKALGTRIWWATSYTGNSRCLKEFFVADPQQYGRSIPDPSWNYPLEFALTFNGLQRGLFEERALVYDGFVNGTLQQELLSMESLTQHLGFYSQFNAYSFEVEALITQFALHYGCYRLVPASRWGAIYLPNNEGYRNVVEMEHLTELTNPPVGGYLQIVDRLLEMMAAVHQLHSMLLPLRCYPPELVRDIEVARQLFVTRPFHYDLSPEQFLCRPGLQHRPPQIVLIDFNSSRMD